VVSLVDPAMIDVQFIVLDLRRVDHCRAGVVLLGLRDFMSEDVGDESDGGQLLYRSL